MAMRKKETFTTQNHGLVCLIPCCMCCLSALFCGDGCGLWNGLPGTTPGHNCASCSFFFFAAQPLPSASAPVSGPGTALSVPEFEGRRRANEADNASLTEIYKAGNLTVFAGDHTHPDHPVQLDFHFKTGSQGTAHWHGLLQGEGLFLDVPHQVLEVNSRESLIATLEYIDEKTETELVFVNFHKSRHDRGDLLRAFSFLGFELVRPDHPALPSWGDVLFMVYPMEREPCPKQELKGAKPGACDRQDGECSQAASSNLLDFE